MDENRMSPGYVYFRSQNCTTKQNDGKHGQRQKFNDEHIFTNLSLDYLFELINLYSVAGFI